MFGNHVDKPYFLHYHVKIVRKGCGDDGAASLKGQALGEECSLSGREWNFTKQSGSSGSKSGPVRFCLFGQVL
jgi:hypothetical protein